MIAPNILPVSYMGKTMTWTMGRNLGKVTVGSKEYFYKYDGEGLRVSKEYTSGGSTVTIKYLYDGVRLLEEYGSRNIQFLYDGGNTPIGFRYDGHTYFYNKNIFGDVIGIFDTNLSTVVTYTYDSWGRLVSIKDSSGFDVTNNTSGIGYINPIRYRGYYYDNETGLYYLQSRYYDPNTGRFINADGQINTSLGVLGCNMPGDLFDTMDEAARDFAEYINEKSIANDCEYGSFIYKKTVWETTTITYYNPNIFGKNFLSYFWNYIFQGEMTMMITKRVKVTKYSYVKPQKGTAHSVSIPINWFGMRNKVAEIHTHGAYSSGYDNDNFSSTDLNNWINYLVTPLGTVRKYNPADGSDITICYDVPYDSNHPWRK